jgi:hypothetical protein
MRLEYVFRKIEPNNANILHGRLSSCCSPRYSNLGAQMPSEGRPPHRRSKFDPFDRRGLAAALGPSELTQIAKTERARVV